MPFAAKPIPLKPYRTRSMNAFLLNALKKSSDDVKLDFQTTVATWNHHVGFTVKYSFRGPDAVILAWTDDYVWNLLNTGTHRRYARGVGYVPKSRPRVIGSFAGAGHMVKSKIPYPGIQAREWTQVIFDNNVKAVQPAGCCGNIQRLPEWIIT